MRNIQTIINFNPALDWVPFSDRNISETTCSNNYYSQKFSTIQTCPGAARFGSVKIDEFVRPPNLRKPRHRVKTKKTHNAIWSRVRRISAWHGFSGLFWCAKRLHCKPLVKRQHSPGVAYTIPSTIRIPSQGLQVMYQFSIHHYGGGLRPRPPQWGTAFGGPPRCGAIHDGGWKN